MRSWRLLSSLPAYPALCLVIESSEIVKKKREKNITAAAALKNQALGTLGFYEVGAECSSQMVSQL